MKFIYWLFGRTRITDQNETVAVAPTTVEVPAEPAPVPEAIITKPQAPDWKAAEEANRAAVRRYFAAGPHPAVAHHAQPAAQIEPVKPTILPDKPFRFIALDVETANGWHGSICQIGLACVGMDGEIFCTSYLVDPEQPFDDFNVRLTGINASMVKSAPTFRQIFPELRERLKYQPVIQHSTFDSRAFAAAAEKARQKADGIQWIDSVQIARKAWPHFTGKGGHGLAHLKTRLYLNFNHHDAGEDARAAAEVVLQAEKVLGLPFQDILQTKARRVPAQPPIDITPDPTGPLVGHIAVFTGTLPISRPEAAALAARAGIATVKTVSRKVTLVIVGDQDLSLLAGHTKSTAHRKAEDLVAQGHEIRILDGRSFFDLVGKG